MIETNSAGTAKTPNISYGGMIPWDRAMPSLGITDKAIADFKNYTLQAQQAARPTTKAPAPKLSLRQVVEVGTDGGSGKLQMQVPSDNDPTHMRGKIFFTLVLADNKPHYFAITEIDLDAMMSALTLKNLAGESK